MILETSFLIDLERETGRQPGPAMEFLEKVAGNPLHITPIIAGEMAAGPRVENRDTWTSFLAPFQILDHDLAVSWEYSRAYRFLAANGMLIGTNDLWIAAAGVAHGIPLVTRNERYFRRVPGLEVLSYRKGAPEQDCRLAGKNASLGVSR